MRKPWLKLLGFVGLIVLILNPVEAGWIDRNELRKTLKETWDSIDTFEYESVECQLDDRGRVDRARAMMRFDVAYGSGGRHMYRSRPTGTTGGRIMPSLVEWLCEDGRKQYGLEVINNDVALVDKIYVRSQPTVGDVYTGPMTIALWLIMPGGKPSYAQIDDGAKVEETKTPDGKRVIRITGDHKGMTMTCDLDPDRDWLPSRVHVKDYATYQATKFEQKNGRWFPVEGTLEYHFAASTPKQGFYLERYTINQPLAATIFRPLPAPEGCMVVDQVTGKTTYQGGTAARKRLEAKRPSIPNPSEEPSVVVPRQPDRFPWIWIGGAGGLILITAGYLMLRRQH